MLYNFFSHTVCLRYKLINKLLTCICYDCHVNTLQLQKLSNMKKIVVFKAN